MYLSIPLVILRTLVFNQSAPKGAEDAGSDKGAARTRR